MSALSRSAERALERAVARGDFDEFAGRGQPLSPAQWGDPLEGEWSLAFRILRQAGAAPRWIELDKEIRQRKRALRAWLLRVFREQEPRLLDQGKLHDLIATEVDAINELIETRNLLAPWAAAACFKMELDREIAEARSSG